MSLNLSEISRDLVVDTIKNNIEGSLAQIRSLRADAYVSTEAPKSYFIYAPAIGYRCPCVFTIVDRINFNQFKDGSNTLTASVFMSVLALVEDRDLDHLTIKADRYLTALHNVLNEKRVLSSDNKVLIWIKVTDAVFSEVYAAKRNTADGMFRKEVHLTCDVMHFEQL